MEICNMKECTGCFACMNICPHNAIGVSVDLTGKTIPEIKKDLCTQCNLCKTICPVNKNVDTYVPKNAYATWSKRNDDIKLSSSGAIAYILSEHVLNNKGIVCGCASESGIVEHICVDTFNDLEKLRGSKYVQSYIGYSYREVKEYLLQNKLVLFIGVPCQIAGLKSYLNKDYDDLILVDLICHGTPPFTYLKEYVSNIINFKKWDSVAFRGNFDWMLTVYNKRKVLYKKNAKGDLYYRAFLDALTYRDNCYNCKYAYKERCSDITIGDYWGLDYSTLKEKYDGKVSVVLTNTEKGINFLNAINNDSMHIENRPLEEPFNEFQGNLLHPTVPHKDRDTFLNHYIKTQDFISAVKTTMIVADCKEADIIYKKNNSLFNKTLSFLRRIYYLIKRF